MTCPKCKAKIGITRQQFITDSGLAAGIICYMCGNWIQEFPEESERFVRRQISTHSA